MYQTIISLLVVVVLIQLISVINNVFFILKSKNEKKGNDYTQLFNKIYKKINKIKKNTWQNKKNFVLFQHNNTKRWKIWVNCYTK